MHGKTSAIYHNKNEIFLNVNSPFEATRYHSLVVEKKTLPECLEVIAWSEDSQHGDEIMGIKHIEFPESILTKPGHQLLKNFLEL